MSYEIVKSLKIRRDGESWVADICSHSSNVTPAYYENWVYTIGSYGYFKTEEELTKSLLLNFWQGELQGATNTKIGKFIRFLASQDNAWYKDITNRYNHLIELQCKKYMCTMGATLRFRKDKECKRILYKMFTTFEPKCKPTIISISNGVFTGYTVSRKNVWFTDSKNLATVYTDTARLYQAVKTVKNNGYNYELLEV